MGELDVVISEEFVGGVSVPILLNKPESMELLEERLKLASSTLGWKLDRNHEVAYESDEKGKKRFNRVSDKIFFDLIYDGKVKMRVVSHNLDKTNAVYIQRPAEGSQGWVSPHYVEQRFRQLLGPNIWKPYSENI